MTDKPVEPLKLVRRGRREAEPYQPGNTESMRHGGYSPRAIEAKAREVHEALIEFAPWLNEAHYAPTLNRYLQATAREQLLHAHVERTPAEKVPVRLWESVTSVSRLAHKLADDLGLTPKGHATIAVLTGAAVQAGASIADLAAKGAELRERAAQRIVTEAIETDADDLGEYDR